jgi:putative heme degradation protein
MSIKLSEFFPRLQELGVVRVVVTNGMAVAEFNSTITDVSLGARSWNFNRDGLEFHLYKDKARAVKLFYGEHPRFKRKLGEIDFLDDTGQTAIMVFLSEDAGDPDNPAVQAMERLVADYGEMVEVEEEESTAAPAAH